MSVNDDNTISTEIPENSEGFKISHCVGPNCGAEILWTETLQQKRLPVDSEPTEDGTIALEDRGLGRVIGHVFSGRNLASMRFRGASLYKVHWATCPDSDMFRRG